MINLTEKPPDLVAMDIKMTIPQTEIFDFLQKKGYEIKGFPIHWEAVEEMLVSEPAGTWHTFTATKEGENQSPENQFLIVFKKEIKTLLKEIA
ncbi:hypothetical protein [Epilithonimonas xixisoli]|uniref:Uncharacterized protein n=1 Tax=Epilithonimonas xixisoli TaxID=1476462 RepID=A0A4V3H2S3_9FLAO|nr:hypothetical protein [Epilithonimonas xixisoli]TDX86201.1 hypothetical protein B0I22_0311 [Epilithonimonas xixisoli]